MSNQRPNSLDNMTYPLARDNASRNFDLYLRDLKKSEGGHDKGAFFNATLWLDTLRQRFHEEKPKLSRTQRLKDAFAIAKAWDDLFQVEKSRSGKSLAHVGYKKFNALCEAVSHLCANTMPLDPALQFDLGNKLLRMMEEKNSELKKLTQEAIYASLQSSFFFPAAKDLIPALVAIEPILAPQELEPLASKATYSLLGANLDSALWLGLAIQLLPLTITGEQLERQIAEIIPSVDQTDLIDGALSKIEELVVSGREGDRFKISSGLIGFPMDSQQESALLAHLGFSAIKLAYTDTDNRKTLLNMMDEWLADKTLPPSRRAAYESIRLNLRELDTPKENLAIHAEPVQPPTPQKEKAIMRLLHRCLIYIGLEPKPSTPKIDQPRPSSANPGQENSL